jgi:hypothetical protein
MSGMTVRRILLSIGAVSILAATVTAAPAAAAPDKALGRALGALWEEVFETPAPDNPFTGGDPCLDLGAGVVAPFASIEPSFTCAVKPGTKLLMTAWSSECSTVESPPYFGTDEAELRECARAADAGYTSLRITVDGQPIAVTEVETQLLTVDLPQDNIFGVDVDEVPTALSVGHGWVAMLHPLPIGTHEIVIRVAGTDVFGTVVDLTTATTIIVDPGR